MQPIQSTSGGGAFFVPSSSSPSIVDFSTLTPHELTNYLLDHLEEPPSLTDDQWNEVLLAAIKSNHPQVVTTALGQGASPHFQDPDGNTPLHYLCQQDPRNTQELQNLLLAQKLIINLPNHICQTPLWTLAHGPYGSKEAIELALQLIQAGADTEIPDSEMRFTPLDCAISRGNDSLFWALLRAGAGLRVHSETATIFAQSLDQPEEALELLAQQSSSCAWEQAKEIFLQKEKPLLETFFMEGQQSGRIYLHPNIALSIPFTPDGRLPEPEKNEHGRHPRIPIQYKKFGLYLKQNPDMPGVEHAVHLLHSLLIGHGTPDVELYKCLDKKKKPFVITCSHTVEGENLHEVLQNNPKMLKELDPHRFCNLAIMAMLTNPEDWKPDNFIVRSFINLEGKSKLELVAIDNDHAFVDPLKTGSGKMNEWELQVKCILFCFGQMRLPVHKRTKELFLRIPIYDLLTHWLQRLEEYEFECDRLFTREEKTIFLQDKTHPMVVSIPFAPGKIANLYEKMTRLQTVLKRPQVTLFDVFYELLPLLAIRYEAAFQEKTDPYQRFLHLAEKQYSKAVAGQLGTKINSRQILQSLQIDENRLLDRNNPYSCAEAGQELRRALEENHQIDFVRKQLVEGYPKPFHRLLQDETKEKVINSIHWDKIPSADAVLKELLASKTNSFRRLHLRRCAAATEAKIVSMIQKSPCLQEISLEDCHRVWPGNGLEWKGKKNLNSEMRKLDRLTSLDLSGTSVSQEMNFQGYRMLKKLSLNHCQILKQVSGTIPALQFLSLENCSSLENIDIEALKLKRVSLKKCTKLPVEKFVCFILKLSDQTSVNSQECPQLQELGIQNGRISDKFGLLSSRYRENEEFRQLVLSHFPSYSGSFEFRNLDSSQEFTPLDLAIVIRSIAGNPAITAIDLKVCRIFKSYTGAALEYSLRQNSNITELNLTNCGLGDLHTQLLASILNHSPQLQVLDLGHNHLTNLGLYEFLKLIVGHTQLNTLTLSKNKLTPRKSVNEIFLGPQPYLNQIAPLLARLTSLQHLFLGGHDFDQNGDGRFKYLDDIFTSFITQLLLMPNLQTLELRNCFFRSVASNAEVLAKSINDSRGSSLRRLELGSNNFYDSGVALIAASLPFIQELEILDLSDDQVFCSGNWGIFKSDKRLKNFTEIVQNLAKLKKLTTLNLSNNHLTSECGTVLANSLPKLRRLTKLDLSNNQIDSIGVVEIAKAFSQHSNLSCLNLSTNSINDEWAIKLAGGLYHSGNLCELSLSHNYIGTSGALAILKKVFNMPQLTVLYLSNNNIDSDIVPPLLNLLPNVDRKLTIDLRHNQLNIESRNILREKFNENLIIQI